MVALTLQGKEIASPLVFLRMPWTRASLSAAQARQDDFTFLNFLTHIMS